MAANTITFIGVDYTKSTLKTMSGPALVELFNKLRDTLELAIEKVKRFANKDAAVNRTWGLLERLNAEVDHKEEVKVESAPKVKTTKTQTASPRNRTRRGTHLTPFGTDLIACRVGSKQATMLDLLKRKNGATMDELIEALSGGRKPWTEATVRSGLGWDIRNKGYGIQSQFDSSGVEHFVLVVPEGQTIPKHYTGRNPAQVSLV